MGRNPLADSASLFRQHSRRDVLEASEPTLAAWQQTIKFKPQGGGAGGDLEISDQELQDLGLERSDFEDEPAKPSGDSGGSTTSTSGDDTTTTSDSTTSSGSPDLRVRGVNLQDDAGGPPPSKITPNTPLGLTVEVVNNGDAAGSATLPIKVDGSQTGTVTVEDLAPGESTTVEAGFSAPDLPEQASEQASEATSSAGPPSGSGGGPTGAAPYSGPITFQASTTSTACAGDTCTSFTVEEDTTGPDIRVVGTQVGAGEIVQGELFTVAAKFENQGDEAGTRQVTLTIMDDDTTTKFVSLDPGETTTKTWSVVAPNRSQFDWAVDGASGIATATSAEQARRETGFRDDNVTIATCDRTKEVDPGETIELQATVLNRNDQPADIQLRWDVGNQAAARSETRRLGANEQGRFRAGIQATRDRIQPGAYPVEVVLEDVVPRA